MGWTDAELDKWVRRERRQKRIEAFKSSCGGQMLAALLLALFGYVFIVSLVWLS